MSPSTHAFALPVAGDSGLRLAVEHLPASGERAADPSAPGVLFCGGFHSSMHGDKARAVNAYCAAAGIACTRFDYRGHGASDGDARRLTLLDWLGDTLCVIDHVSGAGNDPGPANGTPAPLVLVGSSMGAWLAVQATLERPERVGALLLVAAAPDFLQHTLLDRLDPDARERLAAGQEVTLPSPYDEAGWPVTPALIDSGRALAVLPPGVARSVRCPVRMLHGERDDTAPLERAQTLFSRLGSDEATLTILKGGDHRLSDGAALALLRRTLGELLLGDARAP